MAITEIEDKLYSIENRLSSWRIMRDRGLSDYAPHEVKNWVLRVLSSKKEDD